MIVRFQMTDPNKSFRLRKRERKVAEIVAQLMGAVLEHASIMTVEEDALKVFLPLDRFKRYPTSSLGELISTSVLWDTKRGEACALVTTVKIFPRGVGVESSERITRFTAFPDADMWRDEIESTILDALRLQGIPVPA